MLCSLNLCTFTQPRVGCLNWWYIENRNAEVLLLAWRHLRSWTFSEAAGQIGQSPRTLVMITSSYFGSRFISYQNGWSIVTRDLLVEPCTQPKLPVNNGTPSMGLDHRYVVKTIRILGRIQSAWCNNSMTRRWQLPTVYQVGQGGGICLLSSQMLWFAQSIWIASTRCMTQTWLQSSDNPFHLLQMLHFLNIKTLVPIIAFNKTYLL